jgi:RNA-binding protein YhbY
MLDGTSTTDAALERKLVAAVKKQAALKVKLAYAPKARARAQVIEALVRKVGAKDVEITVGIVTHVPAQPPPSASPP